MDDFEFKCSKCDEIHKGVPGFGTRAPIYYFGIPEDEREARVELSSDTCVIDQKEFFVRGCLELPVESTSEPFIFGAWISLSESGFQRFLELMDVEDRENEPPMVGWFSSWFWQYEETERLVARILFRNNGTRPLIELKPIDHPLVIAQRDGLTRQEVVDIYEYYTFDQE